MSSKGEYDIKELMKVHGWELFGIQCNEVIYQHCNEQGSRIHHFWWDGEDAETQAKLLPYLEQTVATCWNETADYDYLFCSVGIDHTTATNMLLRVSDNQWMTVEEVINS